MYRVAKRVVLLDAALPWYPRQRHIKLNSSLLFIELIGRVFLDLNVIRSGF